MNLTQEEWENIKEWLYELLGYYKEQIKIYRGYRHEKYYRREYDKVKDFLNRKSS